MSIRRLFFFLLVATFFLVASGTPINSQNPSKKVIAGRNVNMVSGTQLPNGDPWLQRQNEPSIAASTRNPLHLLAGANDYRTIDIPGKPIDVLPGQEEKKTAQAPREPWLGVFKSFDGGQSWISTLLPGFPQDFSDEGLASPLKGYHAAADPVVRAGTNGLFYYSGIAFNRDTMEGVVFVSRFIDNNNLEKGDCIKYLDTKVIDIGNVDQFLDKPWIAVDLPHGKGKTVTIDGQSIPQSNVYIAFSEFSGEGDTLESKIFFSRSTDCGEYWSEPIEISKGKDPNQGAAIAVDPRANGHVYVAWRQFGKGKKPAAIFIARSSNSGKKFQKAIKMASFDPFDQGSSVATFRTNSYPTLTIDNSGRLYLAWSQRMGGPLEDARIVLSTSGNGIQWSSPAPIEEVGALGHQIMPSLTFAAGKLMMVWYDQRNDISDRFTPLIDDVSGETRHTLDVRVAQAEPGKNPIFEPSKQVSRYLFVLTGQKPNYSVKQIQFNPVNYPLFKIGTWPFMGDYIDIAPSPMFVLDDSGHWRYNTEPSDSTIFHVAWTDNRDIRPPLDGKWDEYNPPNSIQEDPNFYTDRGCYFGDWTKAGMRNQNIYTSRITQGIVAGSFGNTKPLGTLGETPDGEKIPRAFVVFVKNSTDEIKSFRLTIANQPPDGRASFLEFDLLDRLDVKIAPHSSISRSVFVYSPEKYATVKIYVAEIYEPNGQLIPDGLESSVILNPDIQNPDIQNPDIQNPDIMNPDIQNAEVHNPDIMNIYVNPDIMNPDIQNPDIMNPDIQNPDIMNPDIMNPDIQNPDIQNPDIMNPDIQNPDIQNPDIMNPDIMNTSIADPSAGEFTDVIWDLQNIGNTTSTFVFKTLSTAADEDGTLPDGIQAQLLIYRTYTTPAEHDTQGNPCALGKQEHQELILNIINPDIQNPDIQNIDLETPDIQNPDIMNATFSLEPEGVAKVILRLWKPYNYIQSTSRTLNTARTLSFNDPNSIMESFAGFTSGTSRNTTELQDGIPTYASDSSIFLITTKTLAPGEVGLEYSDFLTATGGKKPYSSWSIVSGILPAGLSLNSSTGEISGTPTTAGTSSFTAQIMDTDGQTRTKDLWISISPTGVTEYTISGRVTVGGSDLEGVAINGLPGNPTTDSVGYYTTSVESGWSGTVIPEKAGYTFTPSSRTYSNVTSNQTSQNYTATPLFGPLNSFIVDAPDIGIAGTPFSVTITAKDSAGNTTTYVSGATTLSVDGVGTITPPSIAEAEFIDDGVWTGNVYLSESGSRTITATNNGNIGSATISITAGVAAILRIEDANNETGTEVDTMTITPGGSFTVYAILRDSGDNFIENTSVTWDLIDETGDVGNLVPAGDGKSATFTGLDGGTAKIAASYLSLYDETGTITVTGPPSEDSYEPNDDFGSAYLITAGTYTNLQLFDDDWYMISVPGNKDLKVTIAGVSDNNIDLGLADSAGKYLVGGLSSSNKDTIYFRTTSAGDDYYIRVPYTQGGGLQNTYTLTAEISDNLGLGHVSGTVTGATGTPPLQVRVRIYDRYSYRKWNTLTDDITGEYRISMPPGSYKIRFITSPILDYYGGINYLSEYSHDKPRFAEAPLIEVLEGETTDLIDGQLKQGGTLTGSVRDLQGNTIEGAFIRVRDLDGYSVASAYSDTSGQYTIVRLATGYFKAYVRSWTENHGIEWYNDKPSFNEANAFSVETGQTTSGIDFQLTEGGNVEGRVTDVSGGGVGGVQVVAYDPSQIIPYLYPSAQIPQMGLRSTSTDDNGYYFMNHLPNGNVSLYFNTSNTNHVPEWYDDASKFIDSVPVPIQAGQTTSDINVELAESGAVGGRVTNSSGDGIKDVLVWIFNLEGGGYYQKYVYTNDDGYYRIDRIPVGNVKVRFRPNMYTNPYTGNWAVEWYGNKNSYTEAEEVPVVANETTWNVDAELAENGGNIEGRVTNGSQGIGGVYVSAYDSSIQAQISYVYTDSDGYYSVPRIPTCDVKLVFFTGNNKLPYVSEFYSDRSSYEYATPVSVWLGETTLLPDVVLSDMPNLTVTTTSLPNGDVHAPYSQALVAMGGTVSYHWSLAPGSNPLPDGLYLRSTGVIEGTPTSLGPFPFTVQVVDNSNPPKVATQGLSITISTYGGTDYIIRGTITYGSSPLKGVVMDGLPGNPATNFLGNYLTIVPPGWSGTVTPALPRYFFDPPSRNYDNVSGHQENHDYSAFYGEPLRITTTSLPDGTKDASYSVYLNVEAPDGIQPFEWSLIEGSLPDGLILESSGEIHGSPSTAGDFIFTVQVADSGSPQKSASQYLTLYIAPHHQAFWNTTYPYGGNINSAGLVLDPLDPQVIYAAANWRGIFKSEDAGSSWDNITDYLDLPFDRTDTRVFKVRRNPDEFFTVSHGRIFKSYDEGINWDAINNGISGHVQALTFHPAFLNVLYAGTQENGIFKTADGGAGWSNVSSGLPSDEIRSIAVDPDNPSTVYAGTLNNGIYKSTDDGMSWFSVNNNINLARIDNIVMDPIDTSIIYLAGNEPATGDGIFKSTGGGDTWTKLPVNVSYSWPSGNYIAIDPSDTDIIYSVSYHSIFKSVDGGSNWTETQITPHHVNTIVIDPSAVENPVTERTLYAGTDTEGVFKSTDSGQNWTAVNNGIQALNFPHSHSHSLTIDQSNPQIIYAGSINGGLKSTNKGLSWGSLNLNEWQAGTLATHASDPGAVYAFNHNLWKSTDYGVTWMQLTGSGDICCFGDGDFVIASSSPSTFYLAGLWSGSTPNGIYKSIDSGSTWTLINNGLTNETIRTLAVHPTNADIVFAGTMGDWPIDPAVDYGLFKTTDGGQNWSHVNCGLPEVLHINQIAIYPGDPNIMYMASEGENSGVYRSDDGGNCWWKIFDDNASSVTIDPGNPEIVYVGTWNSGGFYVTLNGGGTWTQLNDGLPIHPGIESIAIDPENPRHVFIGTTAGVYEATLNFDFTVTTEGLPEGVKDESYSVTLKAMGGTEPYTWNVIEGALPSGLTMNSSGLISGIPTAPGTFHFRVQVTDDGESSQSYTKILKITILNTYTLTTTVNPGAGGSLSRNPEKPKYVQGEFVELNITPNTGYTFTGWSGDASGMTNPIHVQMTRDKNITVNLALIVDLPDYYVDPLTAPSQANAGEIIGSSLNLIVGNQGAHDLYPGNIYVAVYLSSDPVITTGDILLWKGRSSITALSAGGTTSDTINADLQIPATVSEGDYHIGALVDESKVIAEQDEDNNSSSLPISITSTEYGYFDIVGYWDGGSTYGIAVDEARNLALIGHGGSLEILDISNPSNPVKRSKLHLSSSLAVTIVTSGNLAYIANGAAGLKVVDFSDADNPVEIGSCDTFQSNARSLDISGNYAYVTDYHQGLRVIDISTPTSPTEIAFLPLPYLSREIKVFGDYAYVTVRRHLAGGEGAPALRIIDISEPADPTLRSTYGFRVNAGIPAIDDTSQYLFVPTAGDGLRILDVSNPDLPSEVSFYDGAPNQSEVTIRGNHAFLDDYGNSRAVILDITNVFNPVEISSYWFENQQALYGFEVAGDLWLVNRWYDSVRILNISDIYSPYEVGSYNETQGLNYFLDISDDHAFIINYKSRIDRLKVLDISNLSDITETATHETPYNIYGIDISGNHAYIPTFEDGLRIADITDPLNPEEVGSYEDLQRARYVVVSGNYAYVADGWDGLRIFDISTPSNPILVSTWQPPGYAWRLALSGNYAYVAYHRNGLKIIDVSDPLNPWEVGSLEFQGRRIRRVAVSENYAYITDEYKTLRVIDVSNPGNPTEVSSFDIYNPVNLTISGNLLFVSDWLLGLSVMDISDPSNPTQIVLLNELFNAQQVVIQDNYIYALNRGSGFYVLEYKLPGPEQTISGKVTFGGSDLQGVLMNGLPESLVTNGSGEYTTTVSTGWAGIVTPTLAEYFFNPPYRIYDTVISDQPNQDFMAYSGDPLVITTTWLPDGIANTGYSKILEVIGGAPDYDWSVVYASLPDGLNLKPSTGEISGIPTETGIFTFTVRVTDSGLQQQSSTRELSLNINAYVGTGYIITGTVTADGLPLDGVVMTGLPENPTTNTSGFYMAAVDEGWSGTVFPSKVNYAFDPSSRSYDPAASNQMDQDYEASSITEEWVARYNGPAANSYDNANAMTTDSSGNIYVTGRSDGSGTSADIATIKYDSTGGQIWEARYNDPGNSSDYGNAIAVDSAGNVYVTGYGGWSQSIDYTTIKYNSNGDQVWVARYDGPGNHIDRAVAIAVDSSGNVYVTGYSYDSGGGNPDYATVKYASNGDQVWAARYDGPANGDDRPVDIALDSSGNVYVTGRSYGDGTNYDYATIKYDNSDGDQVWVERHDSLGGIDRANAMVVDADDFVYVTGYSRRSETNFDYATIKYDSNGIQAWIAWYDNSSWVDQPQALVLDSSGNVYVTGYSSVSTGGGSSYDYSTVMYDNDGVEQWATTYDGPENRTDWAYAIDVDSSGNVYVTGRSLASNGYYEYATAKYSSTGSELWVRRHDGSANGNDQANAIVVDSSGNIVVTGSSHGSSTNDDYATIKYDSAGNQLWIAQYNGPTNDESMNWVYGDIMAMDSSNNVYISGYSYGNGTDLDYTTVKFDSSGNQVWAARYNGTGNYTDYAEDMTVDPSGNVYVTGTTYINETNRDYATVKYNNAGEEQWAVTYDGPANGYDWALAIAVDTSGNVYVTGESLGSGTNSDCTTIKYNSAGAQQWVARYDGPDSSIDEGWGITVDTTGNVYVTGRTNTGTPGRYDFLTIKYNGAGVEQWVSTYGGPENLNDYANFIALDSLNNVYVFGDISDDYGIVKYDNNGNEIWARRYDGPGNSTELPMCLAVDSADNVYVTGMSNGIGTYRDFATIKYDSAGNELWVRRYEGESTGSYDYGTDIAFDSSGNVYVSGRSGGTDTYYDGDCTTIKYDNNGNLLWILKYNGPGNSVDGGHGISVTSSGDVYVAGMGAGIGTGYDFIVIKYRQ